MQEERDQVSGNKTIFMIVISRDNTIKKKDLEYIFYFDLLIG